MCFNIVVPRMLQSFNLSHQPYMNWSVNTNWTDTRTSWWWQSKSAETCSRLYIYRVHTSVHLVSVWWTEILTWLIRRQTESSWVRFQMVALQFFIYVILPIALWNWGDSSSIENEYQEYFLGVKAAGAQGWQAYNLNVPLSWNMGTFTLCSCLFMFMFMFVFMSWKAISDR